MTSKVWCDNNNYLLKLPIEVLDLVYQELPVRSKINLAEVHPYLGKAFSWHIRETFKNISLKRFPLKVWATVLSLCGQTVRNVTFDETHNGSDDKSKFRLLSVFCSNLEVLEMNFLPHCLRPLWSGKPVECTVELLKYWPKMESLRRLSIHQLYQLHIPYLKTLKKVEVLKIISAYSTWEPWSLAELPLNTLRLADLLGCSIKSTNEKMHNSTLEKLIIRFCYVWGEMPWFPKLKSLDFVLNQCFVDCHFPDWVMQHSDTLEYLKFREDSFRPDFFLKVFQGCKNLQTLVLYVTCYDEEGIPLKFFENFEAILKEHGFNKKKQLKFELHYLGSGVKSVLYKFYSEMVDIKLSQNMDKLL